MSEYEYNWKEYTMAVIAIFVGVTQVVGIVWGDAPIVPITVLMWIFIFFIGLHGRKHIYKQGYYAGRRDA